MMTDAEMLEAFARTGAQDAFAEVVRRHIGGVYSAALRRMQGDVSQAKDVTQAVFIALARKASAASGHPQLSAWLYTAVRNEAGHLIRSERRRKAREERAATLMMTDFSPADSLDWGRVTGILDASIDSLPEEDRRAVLMRFMDKRSFGEMAASLGLTEDAARMRVSRALERLRVLLERRGVTSTAAALAAALTENAVGAVPPGLAASVASGATASVWAASGGLAAALGGLLLSPLVAVVAIAGAAVAAAIFEGVQVSTAETRIARFRADLQESQAALTEASRRLAQTRPSALAAVPARSASEVREAGPPDHRAAGDAFMARHPEVRQAFEAWLDAKTLGRYGPLFRQLGLTPDQIHKFETLNRPWNQFSEDGTDLGTITLEGASAGSYGEVQGQLRALLGEAGYRAYETYNTTGLNGQILTAGLASLLAETDSPLTADQAQRMASAFSSSQGLTDRAVDWGSVSAQAQGILSAAQLAQLDNLRALRESWTQVTRPTAP